MIGNKIRYLRRKNLMTQKELAKALGVSTGAVGFWEIGKREPDNQMLQKLADFFDVTIDYLLGNEKENIVTIMGRNGSYKKFELSEKNIKALEILVETMKEEKINS